MTYNLADHPTSITEYVGWWSLWKSLEIRILILLQYAVKAAGDDREHGELIVIMVSCFFFFFLFFFRFFFLQVLAWLCIFHASVTRKTKIVTSDLRPSRLTLLIRTLVERNVHSNQLITHQEGRTFGIRTVGRMGIAEGEGDGRLEGTSACFRLRYAGPA